MIAYSSLSNRIVSFSFTMQSNARCPFSPEEITLYRRFKAYDFDNDTEFQRDYSHSNDTPSADLVDSLTAEQALQLQNKVAYFTRKYGDIDIKKYIQWQKAMQAMTNEKNTSTVDNSKKMSSTAYSQLPYTMRRFIEYDFDNDKQFQTDLPELLRHVHENGSLDTAATATDDIDERKLIRAKLAYFDKHLLPLTWDEYIAAMEPPVNNTTMSTVTATDTTPVKCPITGQLASSDQQQCPVLGAMTDTSGHDVSSPVKPFEPTNATLIVYAHPTRKNGSKGGLDEITMYESTSMNEVQVGKLRQTIEQSIRHEPAALLLTADTMQSVDQYGDSSRAIETRDWRVFSSPPSSVKAAEAYAQLLNELGSDSEGNPPLVVVFNGRVSPMTMNWFSVAKTRVCTEDIVVRPARPLSDESLTYWPVNGLYTLTHLNRVAGIGLYLQFNPQVTLRTPDCLSLGLIDRFVPEKFLGDWLRQLRSTFPVGGETNVP
ncbi:hypothetical protein BDF22DRAFT_20024 [Syncephalis plumigaleata]|nr:hypothetical protein BDF22DRAFT_20024 [Syncephalis plumigaleata]